MPVKFYDFTRDWRFREALVTVKYTGGRRYPLSPAIHAAAKAAGVLKEEASDRPDNRIAPRVTDRSEGKRPARRARARRVDLQSDSTS